MPEIPPGTVIDGRYKVISRLGTGGMADVFLAEDQQLGRKLAVKLLHRRFAEDPGFVERFRREAQAAAGLQHPNVVSVYDRGEYDGTYYIAMEYVPGRTLKQLIRDDAPLDPVRAIDLTIQVLKAARFAHRRGVIHRDLKPHNVIVDDTDHAKVTDFGIARAGASDMTETGSIMGTAQYLSPEQAQGHAVSAASDLYSVAVVLYELLTGTVPFDAEAAVTIALKHVSEAPRAISALNPSIPPELEQVVMWALNKNPADRPADADRFVAALEQARAAIVARGRGQRTASIAALSAAGGVAGLAGAGAAGAAGARQPAPDPGTMPPLPPVPPPDWESNGEDGAGHDGGADGHDGRRGARRWLWVLLLLVLLAGGGVAAYLLTRPAKRLVPTVVLEKLTTARAQLQNDGFGVNLNYQTDKHAAGIVINQYPLGNQKVDEGSTVTLTVSNGPGNGTVPSVQGLQLDQAKKAITRAKLKVGRILMRSSATYAQGEVIQTDPTAGQTPPVGTPVTITVSTGKPLVAVPDVSGQSEADARSLLGGDGFNVTTSNQSSTTVKVGNVISTSPGAGTKVASGSTVNLVIAQKPTTATVPSVTGKPRDTAESVLKAAGFHVTATQQATTDQARDGVVLTQTPTGNATAKYGSTVTIVVGKLQTPTTPTTPSTPTTSSTPTTPTTTSP
jgi:serine/threonine-protein kinase